MSKLGFVVFGSAFMFITVILVDALSDVNEDLGSPGNVIGEIPGEASTNISTLLSLVSTLWNMMTFNVQGVPFFFSIVFWVFMVGMLYIILDLLKDVIPFT